MKVKQDQQRKGFTIIEVVLVLAIAGLIFLIVFLAVPALQRSQRDTQRRNDVSRFMSQLSQYQSNNGGNVPDSGTDLQSFRNRYLTTGDDNFADPSSGNVYGATYRGNSSSFAGDRDTMESGNSAPGMIYYYRNAKCDGESVTANTGNRNVAVATELEGGAIFCQDNS